MPSHEYQPLIGRPETRPLQMFLYAQDGSQRLFSDSGVLNAQDVRELLE